MSMKSQIANMRTIAELVSQDLGYIFGDRESGPNGAKKAFHSKSKAFLRALGNNLGFTEFKVWSNPGGIAVSGEITLMGLWHGGNGLYFRLSEPLRPLNAFLFRTISHMKDYSGGRNQWLPASMFEGGDYARLMDALLALKQPSLALYTLPDKPMVEEVAMPAKIAQAVEVAEVERHAA